MENERLREIEERSMNALIILATMTIASALVCCFSPVIPEQLLLSAATTMACSGLGVMGIALIRLTIVMEQFNNI